MPHASPEEREAARKNLYDFVGVLLRIASRYTDEELERERAIRAKNGGAVESGSGHNQPPL